jgi:hypothetical protein
MARGVKIATSDVKKINKLYSKVSKTAKDLEGLEDAKRYHLQEFLKGLNSTFDSSWYFLADRYVVGVKRGMIYTLAFWFVG